MLLICIFELRRIDDGVVGSQEGERDCDGNGSSYRGANGRPNGGCLKLRTFSTCHIEVLVVTKTPVEEKDLLVDRQAGYRPVHSLSLALWNLL